MKVVQIDEDIRIEYSIKNSKTIQCLVYADGGWKGTLYVNAKDNVTFGESDLESFTYREALALYNHIMDNIK